MSNNENSTGENRQVPVETYKCSQCNFYTNHEYYLQQHNLTHSLQVLMDHYKRNQTNYDPITQPQACIKPHSLSHTMQEPISLRCLPCNFETDQETYYKQHILTHNVQLPLDPYRLIGQSNFEGSEENYIKPLNIGQNIPSLETFSSRSFETTHEGNVKPHNLTQNSFETVLLKPPEDVSVLDTFRCSVNNCMYHTQDENEWKQHSLSHDLQTPCPEIFRCSKCDFETHQEHDLKQHIKYHQPTNDENVKKENDVESNQQPTVLRCNNCDYETNLKAFLKRHMLQHTVKVEVKLEVQDRYRCSQCNFETEHEKFLERHELSHKENKYFRCQKCNFETLYKKMYLKHLKAHKAKVKDDKKEKEKEKSKVTIIKCNDCSFETNCQEQLDVHKKLKHTENKAFDIVLHKCLYCTYQTNWEPCLKRHVQRVHFDDTPVKEEQVEEPKKEKRKVRGKAEAKANVVKKEKEPPHPPQADLFRCDNCDFTSKSKQYLILHLKRSHIKEEKPPVKQEKPSVKQEKPPPSKLYECKFRNCKFQTSIRSNYVHHLRKHQSQNPQRVMFHFCDLCDHIAKTEENLADHKKRLHLSSLRVMYKCNQCSYKTVYKHSLKTHSIKHKKYTCNVCEEELDSAFALVKHRRTHQINPKNRIFLCDVCGFQSKNDRSLKMHKKTHNPEFKCPDCPFQTHSKVNFQNHCINHKSADEVTMFPCPHCSYQSRLKRNLAWHMKRHADPSKAKLFKCPSCEYQTFTNAQLKSHLMVHKSKEEVIMLKCDFCTFETKRKSNMVQHRLRHLKDSPDVPLLSCPDCNYTTVAKRHLNKHRKTHNVNPDKMFQCSYCSYKIHRKVYLMRHMENHKTIETFGVNDQWQRYTFPPQPQVAITGVTVIPNLGQNIPHNLGNSLM